MGSGSGRVIASLLCAVIDTRHEVSREKRKVREPEEEQGRRRE